MSEETSRGYDVDALRETLDERERMLAEATARELAMADEAMGEKASRLAWWESMIAENSMASADLQVSSYKSMGKSLAGLLGAGIRDQAKIMIPFEIAEATRDMARFLGTGDPMALAASLKHALAAKQYAEAAKSGGGGASGGGRGGGRSGGGWSGGGAGPGGGAGQTGEQTGRQARVIVNVGRQVGLVDTYDFARTLIDAINENLSDDVILEVQS